MNSEDLSKSTYLGVEETLKTEAEWLARFPLRGLSSATTGGVASSLSSDGSDDSTKNIYGIRVVDFDKEQNASRPVPEFMKNWTSERRKEFQREVVNDLKENISKAQKLKEVLSMAEVASHLQSYLGFSDKEMRQIWQQGHAAAAALEAKTAALLAPRLNKVQSHHQQHWIQQQFKKNGFSACNSSSSKSLANDRDAFMSKAEVLDVMAGPGPDIASPHLLAFTALQTEYDRPLHHRWEELSEKEQLLIRVQWQPDAEKLNLLVNELLHVQDEALVPVICDNYKELLMSERFMLLLQLRLKESPPRTEKEKEVFIKINKFVVSLYEDLEAMALQNEREQLKKIKLLCTQALIDINKLTEYATSMKQVLDRDFFAYLLHAIHAERKRIQKEGNHPDAAPSQWLLILMIIQKGVQSLYEKDIWEDVLWVTMVVTQRAPEVRRKLLEVLIAQMPKADWKQFKKICQRTSQAIAKSLAAGENPSFPACPWVPEAVAQLARDLEAILPDWMIEGMLTDFDKQVMKQQAERMSFLWGEKDLEALKGVNVTLPDIPALMKSQVEQATEHYNAQQKGFAELLAPSSQEVTK